MSFKLENVVPWGRNSDEYIRMFDLKKKELQFNILSCADGPASFNSEMTKRGKKVISCDPIYEFTAEQLETQIENTYDKVMKETYNNQNNFVWDIIKSPEKLGEVRLKAMKKFLSDFKTGKLQGRYLAASLPFLPLKDKEFDLAICSHFLFLYTEQLSFDFHLASIMEMCRVAKEVRIFPLLDLDLNKSSHIPTICSELYKAGLNVEINKVPYEFQRGGNEMMKVFM